MLTVDDVIRWVGTMKAMLLWPFKPNVEKKKRKEDVQGLIECVMQRKWPDVSFNAINALAMLGSKEAIDALINVVEKEHDYFLRVRTLDVLGKVGDSFVVDRLLPFLKNKDVARATAKALAGIGDKRAVRPLILAFEAGQPGSWEALKEFSKKGWEPVDERDQVYFLMASDQFDLAVKYKVSAIGPLIAALKYDPLTDNVKKKVHNALENIGSPAVNQLIDALIDGSRRHGQFEAAKVLGQIGDVRAVPALIKVLHIDYSQFDVILNLGKSAEEALEKISGKKFGNDEVAWVRWWSGATGKEELIDALDQVCGKGAGRSLYIFRDTQ